MGAVASDPLAGRATASALAVAMTSAVFYLSNSLAVPAPIRLPGYAPGILYVMLADPDTTLCGIWDGADANGSAVSGAVTCNGERVPPDDPRFPRVHPMRPWT